MQPAQTKRNILIVHTGALGDFVLTWGVAMAISRMNPQSRIFYVTHHSKGLLASRFIGTESATFDTGGWHTLFSDAPALLPPAQGLLDRTRAVFSFVSAGGELFTRNLRNLAPDAEITCLAPLPPADYPRHITAFYQDQLAGAPALLTTYRAMLKSISTNGVTTPRQASPRILIHPGSGSPKKCWPLDRFLQLAHHLREGGHQVDFLLGEAELERFSPADLASLSQPSAPVRPTTCTDLADELLRSALLITNDNGPGHLAGILGVRVLSLFGPTSPDQWRPLGPRAAAMQAMSLPDLPVGEVADAALQCLSVPLPVCCAQDD